jgi:hypothetical protein
MRRLRQVADREGSTKKAILPNCRGGRANYKEKKL